jgi:hypothetical protein
MCPVTPHHRFRRWQALCLTLAVALSACGSPTGSDSNPGSDAPSASPAANLAAARAVLDHALAQLESIHPDPFHAVDRTTFVNELDALKRSLEGMTADQAMVGLMRLWARLSVERDGHQFAFLADGADEPILPIRVYEFDEGVFITAAISDNTDLAGAQLVAVDGHPIADVLAALEPLVPRDGPSTVPAFRPIYLLKVAVLRGLGLVGDGDVELEIDDGNETRTVSVTPVPVAEFEEWAGWLAYTGLPPRDGLRATEQREETIWVEHLPEGAVYLRYPAVFDIPQETIDEFDAMAAAHAGERIILDLRQNPGGDNHNYVNLLSHLTSPAIDRPGRLFVLADRVTFSAAANFSTEIEQKTQAVFVGEAPGGGLNFWDDVAWEHLDDYVVPMRVAISVRYWQKSTPDDPRLTIDPDLAVPSLAADYFAGRDPVLQAALTMQVP